MSTTELLPCPFCGGEAELLHPEPGGETWFHAQCSMCVVITSAMSAEKAIAAWNRRATPPAPAPWAWLCNGKGDGWEERDKVVRDPEMIDRYRERPDYWRIEPLYLNSPPAPPAPVPDGWVMVPKEPTPEMVRAGSGAQNTVSDCGGGLVFAATETDIYRAMISAAPAAPNGWQDISSAPKDGTVVDLWVSGIGRLTDQWWDDGCWGWLDEDVKPTHWQPLPAAPTEGSD